MKNEATLEKEMTLNELEVFDIVEHKYGEKQLLLEINGYKFFASLDGGWNMTQSNPFTYQWKIGGEITKLWRLKHKKYAGDFLRDLNTNNFEISKYFNLEWARYSEAEIELRDARHLLKEALKAVEEAEERLKKEKENNGRA